MPPSLLRQNGRFMLSASRRGRNYFLLSICLMPTWAHKAAASLTPPPTQNARHKNFHAELKIFSLRPLDYDMTDDIMMVFAE